MSVSQVAKGGVKLFLYHKATVTKSLIHESLDVLTSFVIVVAHFILFLSRLLCLHVKWIWFVRPVRRQPAPFLQSLQRS